MSTIKHQGLEYIEGIQQPYMYEKCQICCGEIIGFCKVWIPCVGCFCCCNYPYVTIPQGSKGLFLRYNRYIKTCQPGLYYVNPISQQIVIKDCRIIVIALPVQRLMTKDNISITVDSCLYYYISVPHLTQYRVADLQSSLIKITGGVIKNTIATFTFQQLLEKKKQITEDIESQVTPIIKNWGISITNICLKNFGISKQLQNQLVSAPIARRNAESKIITAQGQVEIAKLLGGRSKILDNKTAIQVRYLETLKGLARNAASRMLYRSF